MRRPCVPQPPVLTSGLNTASTAILGTVAVHTTLPLWRSASPASRADPMQIRDLSEAFPSPGWLLPVPGRLSGELGAGGDVELGEHVCQMGLHRPS